MNVEPHNLGTIVGTAFTTGGIIWAALARTLRGYITSEVNKAAKALDAKLEDYQRKDVAAETQKHMDDMLHILTDDVRHIRNLLDRQLTIKRNVD